MIERKRPGASLFRFWALASLLYCLVAGALSVAPIRTALAQANEPQPPPTTAPQTSRGPVPEAPDTPTVKVAKSVAKQAAIVFAPPLLTLWFGWDLWFAVVGFLSPRDRTKDEA
jgi:hypothetical protein